MYNRLKIHFRCVESSRKIHVEWVIEPSHSRDPDCILFIAQLEERMGESWVRMASCGPTKWSYEFCLFTTLESRALPLSLTIHSLFYITRDRKPLPEPPDRKHCQKFRIKFEYEKKSYLKMKNFRICKTHSLNNFHKAETQDFFLPFYLSGN